MLLFFRKIVIGPHHLCHPGVAADLSAVASDEIPVERIERASIWSRPLLYVVHTRPAIVRHPVDVRAARRLGFGREQSAIGKLAHPDGVGQFDPFIGIAIDAQIPFMQRVRINPGEHCEITGDHQSLDMMGIGLRLGLCHRRLDAGHFGISRPIEIGKSARVAEKIAPFIARHF
jgi:hypothetical protein